MLVVSVGCGPTPFHGNPREENKRRGLRTFRGAQTEPEGRPMRSRACFVNHRGREGGNIYCTIVTSNKYKYSPKMVMPDFPEHGHGSVCGIFIVTTPQPQAYVCADSISKLHTTRDDTWTGTCINLTPQIAMQQSSKVQSTTNSSPQIRDTRKTWKRVSLTIEIDHGRRPL